MKTVIFLFILMMIFSCGGENGQSALTDINADNSGIVTITSIEGNGSSPDIFDDAIIVSGSGFLYNLEGTLDGEDLELFIESHSSLKAYLPADITEGTYELVLVNEFSSASSSVTILKGETGSPGQDGEDGYDGMSIVSIFSCNTPSIDLDLTDNIRSGVNAAVTQFSDGSYFIRCSSSYYYYSAGFWDTSYNSEWYAENSVGVQTGELTCIPWYVKAVYSTGNNEVMYVSLVDTTQYDTISCSQTYP